MISTRLLLASATLAIVAVPAAFIQQRPAPNVQDPGRSQAVDDVTRSAVLAARDAIWRAWFANDTAALRRLLPRSTTAGGGNGWETREEIIAGSVQSKTSGRRLVALQFDDTRIHRNGDVVVVFANYTMEVDDRGRRNTITGRASEVFVLDGGIWRNPFWYLGDR